MNLSITETLCYSTIRIECSNSNGKISTGTGFLFAFVINTNIWMPVLVTNKHVVEGYDTGKFIVTKSDSNGLPINTEHYSVVIPNIQRFIKKHPSKDVDLCALPFAPIINHADSQGVKLFFRCFDSKQLPTSTDLDSFGALEEVLMIGYPNGIWDQVNNMPILRRGSTATHPCIDYNGKKEFMIDAACFPGSSGSPVLVFNHGSYITRNGGIVVGSRAILVGILYAGPQHTATGEIEIVEVPTSQQAVAFSRIPNNLGVVIKAERILELEALFR